MELKVAIVGMGIMGKQVAHAIARIPIALILLLVSTAIEGLGAEKIPKGDSGAASGKGLATVLPIDDCANGNHL